MRKTLPTILACLFTATLVAVPAFGEYTRFWKQSSYMEFEKGTAKGVALRSDGMLVPAPRFAPFADPNVAYLWSLRADSKGNLYAGGGSNAKVLRFDAQGHPTTVFESQELAAQALAIDSRDHLYVGTSPDGKVYKITPRGERSVFFEPKTKYIWALASDSDGTLYVATGDKGEVFAVTPEGKGRLFYKSDERHIRSLAFDAHGNLLLGTEPSGLILLVERTRPSNGEPPAAGAAFVTYETAGKEVTSIVTDADGNAYAAAIGEKAPAVPTIPIPGVGAPQVSVTFTATGQPVPTAAPVPVVAQPIPFIPFLTVTGGSHVYRIAPDGSPKELWSSRTDLVYSLGFSPAGKLLLGTGNNGEVIRLEGDDVFSALAKTASAQVTGLVLGSGGKLYLCTANPGKIFTLGPEIEPEGTFESEAFDAKIFARWGRLTWWGENGATDGKVVFYVRSGNTSNPEKSWSPWNGPYQDPQGQTITCPPARFAQWKAVFQAGTAETPTIDWVSLAYLRKNVAPVIDNIILEKPGVRVQGFAMPMTAPGSSQPVQLQLPSPVVPGALPVQSPPQPPPIPKFEPPPQGYEQRGYQSVVWSAHDENEDEMIYSIYYRGEGEKNWKLLKDKLKEKFYSWDTTTMPDGPYYLKVVASDEPSNPPSDALTASRVGERFVVDNTPPTIENLRAETGSPEAHVRFDAQDPASALSRAEYSLDAGDWMLVFPVGQLSDFRRESYEIALGDLAPGEHTISVRVFDRYENSSTAKVTFTVSTAKGKKR